MELGISSFTFGWAVQYGRLNAAALVERAVAWREGGYNIRRVQFGDNLSLHALSPADLDDLRRRLDAARLTPEVGLRGLTPEHLAQYVDVAKALGAPLIRAVIDRGHYEPDEAAVVAVIRAALPALERHDLTLGLENHDRWPADVFDRVIRGIDSPHVGVCLDTANSLGLGEGIDHILARLGPHAVNLHVKDYAIRRLDHTQGFVIEGRPAGAGMLDIHRVIDHIRGSGRCRSATLELWTVPGETPEQTIDKEHQAALASIRFVGPMFSQPSTAKGSAT